MNRFTQKIAQFQEIYVRKLDSKKMATIKEQKIDVVSLVLHAVFGELIENTFEYQRAIPIIKTENFYDKLVRLKVKQSVDEVPKLTQFLSYKNNNSMIEVKQLAATTQEFLQSTHLQSFGTKKAKEEDGDNNQ